MGKSGEKKEKKVRAWLPGGRQKACLSSSTLTRQDSQNNSLYHSSLLPSLHLASRPRLPFFPSSIYATTSCIESSTAAHNASRSWGGGAATAVHRKSTPLSQSHPNTTPHACAMIHNAAHLYSSLLILLLLFGPVTVPQHGPYQGPAGDSQFLTGPASRVPEARRLFCCEVLDPRFCSPTLGGISHRSLLACQP